MSRDKQSLEEIKSYDDSYWLRYLAENTIFDTENIKAHKEWLIKQLEAEKERADKAEKTSVEFCKDLFESEYQVSQLRKQVIQSQAREQKLREAIESSMELGMLKYSPYAYEHFEEILDSLYPKEEKA